MQTKYYGSIMVSKTMGVGSTPTVCDLYEEFMNELMTSMPILFLCYALILTALCILVCVSMAFLWGMIDGIVEELKKVNKT